MSAFCSYKWRCRWLFEQVILMFALVFIQNLLQLKWFVSEMLCAIKVDFPTNFIWNSWWSCYFPLLSMIFLDSIIWISNAAGNSLLWFHLDCRVTKTKQLIAIRLSFVSSAFSIFSRAALECYMSNWKFRIHIVRER